MSRSVFLDSIDNFNTYFSSNNDIIFFHQNIRSIKKNFDIFLAYIGCLHVKPHVIVLSEAWLRCEEDVMLYSIPDYQHFVNCSTGGRAGGVVMYVLQSLSPIAARCSVVGADIIMVSCILGNRTFKLVGVYRLHGSDASAFIRGFSSLINSFGPCDMVCLGDFNIDINNDNTVSEEYLNSLCVLGFDQLIDQDTRVQGLSSSCIDHIWFRSRFHKAGGAVIATDITDHYAIACAVDFGNVMNSDPVMIVKKRIDYRMLVEMTASINWDDVYGEYDVNHAFDLFYDKFEYVIKQCSDEEHIEVKGRNTIKPWMTAGLTRAFKTRDKLYKLCKRKPDDAHAKRNLSKYKHKLFQWVKNAKHEYYSNIFRDNAKNPKAMWKTVNKLIRGNSVNTQIALLNNNNVVNNKMEIAETFNTFFVNEPIKLAASFSEPSSIELSEYNQLFGTSHNPCSFYFCPVSLSETINTVYSISLHKRNGDDLITPVILRNTICSIAPVLTNLFNKSIEQGCFPDKLKKATVVPIHKKGDRMSVGNYRPISLLPVLSKILEKLVKTRVLNFLETHNFFFDRQFGFRNKLNTEIALQTFLSDIYSGLNQNLNKKSSGLFLDITKAFDTVNHNLLLCKLERAGVRGLPLQWFESYLKNRTQVVKIGELKSNIVNIKYGVPQGSVLGPILFLIFINDFYVCKYHGRITAFADDTALSYDSSGVDELYYNMQQDLDKMSLWFHVNKIKLNVSKSIFLNFSLSQSYSFNQPLQFHSVSCKHQNCSCEIIGRRNQTKYLGLTVDENLSWKSHISDVKKYLRQSLKSFYFLRRICPSSSLRQIYFSLVHSKLEYGLTLWGGTYKSNLRPIIVLQKRFVRMVTGAVWNSNSFPLFLRATILPLRHLFIYKVLRIFYNRSGSGVQLFGIPLVTGYRTRGAVDGILRPPRPVCTLFQKTFLYLRYKFFNSLPVSLRSNNISEKLFAKKLKKLLLSFNPEEIENSYYNVVT
jgi:hypothetical protein